MGDITQFSTSEKRYNHEQFVTTWDRFNEALFSVKL